MPFDWNEYLLFARELEARTDEAAKRSAISRAYYCVFHLAKDYAIENLGYQFRPDQPTHKQLWDLFDGKGATSKAVYSKGMTLKRFRQDADYKNDVQIADIVQALQAADNALIYLDQLSKQKLP